MRSLSREHDSPQPLTAEPWLTILVEAIKKEDHEVAEREHQATRRAELIAQQGPLYWRKFTDTLEMIFRQMDQLFGNDVTKGTLTFTRSPYGGGVSINKSAYPFVTFSAVPNFSETTAHFTYTVVNPEIPNHTGVPGRFLACRFGVEGDAVVMNFDGKPFQTPESAAKFLIEKLFTIPLSTPAEVAERREVSEVEVASEPEVCAEAEALPEPEAPVETALEVSTPVLAAVEPEIRVPPPLPTVPSPAVLPVNAAEVRTGYASRLLASASRILGGGSVTKLALVPPSPPAPVVETAVFEAEPVEESPILESAEPVFAAETEVPAPRIGRRPARPLPTRVRVRFQDPRRSLRARKLAAALASESRPSAI